MNTKNGVKDIVRCVALTALFLIPLTPLVVVSSFFFPFITGKAFYFRILAEVAVVAWLALAMIDRAYRPRFSWIGAAVLGFVVWMFVADVFAINSLKAFWSNFERMEGWVLLAHLLGLFFAMSSILRVEKKWRAWFVTSLGVAFITFVYALLQLNGSLAIHQGSTRIDATLGNSAYFAIYMLFNVFIALWLALTERRAWIKWLLITFAFLESVLIFFTETRGTIIGLVLTITLAAFLTAVTAGHKARRLAAAAFVLILVLIGSFYLARNSSFVQNNHVLQRVASISLNDGQTRFTIWRMAWSGVLERPLIGYGQEGFNYIFNKYYEPSLYKQEPWFDRAHNAFMDWLTAGGIPAFLLYISLFGSAIFLLWRSSELSRPERIALTAALVGYAVHNLFVFDNLYSYIYFFAILAMIDSQVSRPIARFDNAHELSAEESVTYVVPAASVVVVALIWFVNSSGLNATTQLIKAIVPSQNPMDNFAVFEKLLKNPPFAAQEIREQLIAFSAGVAQNQQVSGADKTKVISFAIQEMQKQVDAYPLDARGRLQLAYAYRIAGDSAQSLKEIQVAQSLSPKKEQILIEAGATAWDAGDNKLAQEYFNKAYELGPQFQDLAAYAAAGNIVSGDKEAASKILLEAYGTTEVDSDILTVAYYRTKNWSKLIEIWQTRVQRSDANVNTWFGLAAAYYMAGDKASAINTVNSAVRKYPEAAASGAAAIKQIESGPAAQ